MFRKSISPKASPTKPPIAIKPSNKSPDMSPTHVQSQDGMFDFRAVLRKTNFDPHKTLRKAAPPADDENAHRFDFRAVLKKKNVDKEEQRMKKHIYT